MNTNQKTGRLAGFFYLMVIIFGAFAEVGVRGSLIVPGDAAATASKIMSSQSLFRVGFISDLVMMAFYLLLAYTLYIWLKPADHPVSLLFVFLTVASVAEMSLNMLNQFAALLLLSGDAYLNVFSPVQLQALALFFLNLHKYGYFVAQIFFGLWLLPVGYAGLKSGYLPKVLSILVIAACFGHLIQFFQIFLLPGYEAITYPGLAIATVGEFSLCLWLLIKGARFMPAQ